MSSVLDGKVIDEKEFNSAIARGFAVLECFDSQNVEMTLSQVAARTGLSPATARRCLYTLSILGYVRQHGRKFTLGARVLTLSSSYMRSSQIDEFLLPELRQLVDVFGDASSVAILDENMVLYLAHTSRQSAVRPIAAIGARYPAHATSLGKVLLAHADSTTQNRFLATAPFKAMTDRTVTDQAEMLQVLKEAKRLGYALGIDELDYGIASIAVPVFDSEGRAVAAINTSGYSGRLSAEALIEERLSLLLQASRNITAKLSQYPVLVKTALTPAGH
ncbi:IclR family transcriptional regulator [Pelagibacterium halotolerans]|uniref:Transcriptional regulator, IclR family n=1 Tax=Pelagibacterium halotolerans (strain DSM 22347 / JCM 15775 / CGMCC 1.7692 / B2) TaxID=1082931 RepID=G4RGF8_PELHB|nr:IclR family transcriptional regulator C-terminal domain-containing protein [Pelagibacterium halotolerans]AEQ50134.1 transcriptional regulator, IclR family [Pelagibacterium halotolerans B2]QJR19852.1 helix-turn-helix domain-containing protein [Pelagibacterium halotolerans]SEA48775.1 transcriptional regulator, IclR family [Pelagibacterium halotolerans]